MEAQENKKLKLSEFLEACLDFRKDPSSKNGEVIKDFIGRMTFMEYMPINQKHVNIVLILSTIPEDDYDDPVDCMIKVNVGKIIYGLLSYVINLENDLSRDALTSGIVDLLYQFGVVDAIVSKCGADYARFSEMVQEALNFSNLFSFARTASLMSTESIEDLAKTIRDTKNELTPKMLEDMKAIAVSGSPEFAAYKETLINEAIEKAMEKEFDKLKEKEPEAQEKVINNEEEIKETVEKESEKPTPGA